jgi:phage portal protein BeeE
MKVIPGPDGWPEAFEYTAGGKSVRFAGEAVPGVRPILHVKLFNPVNDHYGMSPIEAAATAIDIHNTAARWNKALLDNSARPSGALVYTSRDGNLSPEQYDRLKAELEQGFQGAAHAGRPLLLEGGLWKSMSLSPKDMDFIEAKHAAAREIALALGVPPMLLGIPGDNTYANYAEANRTFWRQTVLRLVARTAKALSAWLSPGYTSDPALSLSKGGAALEFRPTSTPSKPSRPNAKPCGAAWRKPPSSRPTRNAPPSATAHLLAEAFANRCHPGFCRRQISGAQDHKGHACRTPPPHPS